MNKLAKSILIYLVVAIPVMLLVELASNNGHITLREALITLVQSSISFIVVTATINWIGKQQPKKA